MHINGKAYEIRVNARQPFERADASTFVIQEPKHQDDDNHQRDCNREKREQWKLEGDGESKKTQCICT